MEEQEYSFNELSESAQRTAILDFSDSPDFDVAFDREYQSECEVIDEMFSSIDVFDWNIRTEAAREVTTKVTISLNNIWKNMLQPQSVNGGEYKPLPHMVEISLETSWERNYDKINEAYEKAISSQQSEDFEQVIALIESTAEELKQEIESHFTQFLEFLLSEDFIIEELTGSDYCLFDEDGYIIDYH